MSKNKHTVIQGIIISRKNLIEVIMIAVFLGLGVNLIGGYVFGVTEITPRAYVLIGVVFCIISVLYLAFRLIAQRVQSRSYEGFLVYDNKRNDIVLVPRYEFSEDICRYKRAAFLENTALKTQWEMESLKSLLRRDDLDEETIIRKPLKAAQLLSEAVEYFILSRLSTHLTDYFSDINLATRNLKKYRREDIPDVLLSNRFLEMFSRPMEDRPTFVGEILGEKEVGTVVMQDSEAGTIYESFDLILPKVSTVRRVDANKIVIDTRKLNISITIRFEGYCAVLRREFHEVYLGIDDWIDTIDDAEVKVDIVTRMKLPALFSPAGWRYYGWIDSFLDEIDEALSVDTFFNRIGWESALTFLQCSQRAKEKQRRDIRSKKE